MSRYFKCLTSLLSAAGISTPWEIADCGGESSASGKRGGKRPRAKFPKSVDDLFEYSLRNLQCSVMLVISINNADN